MTTYAELQTAIIEDTHRADLTSLLPRFIRLGEGLIRRDLRAYELLATLDDTDRVTAGEGVYTLPGTAVDIRSIHLVGRQGDALMRVMPNAIRRLDTAADVVQYCQHGDGTIEFRGIPSTTQEFEVRYFGMPAPLADVNTNTLLTDHEGLYQAAATYYLYLHTQDRELAQDQANTFDAVMERINEMMARKIGGGAVAPTYNFATRSSY
jgi:hypothetical protein